MPIKDILIVGGGLAGSILALRLIHAGLEVCVVDPDLPHNASKVASGLIDPLAGQRYLLAWQADAWMPKALSFYRSVETDLNASFLTPMPMYRFFTSEHDRSLWEKKKDLPRLSSFFGQELPPNANGFFSPFGGTEITVTHFLKTRVFLEHVHRFLRTQGRWIQGTVSYEDLLVDHHGVTWHSIKAKAVIFCQGHQAISHPLFAQLKWCCVKGDILTVRTPIPDESHCLHRGKWLLPHGDGIWRVAPTYIRSFSNDSPTQEGREELAQFVSQFSPHPFEITDHQAGIRPALQDNKPVAFFHPQHPHFGIFNGFGSRGVMWIPPFAEEFIETIKKHLAHLERTMLPLSHQS